MAYFSAVFITDIFLHIKNQAILKANEKIILMNH